MGVTFDHVEGVVQKAGDTSPAPAAQESSSTKPAQESHEDARKRMERMARRLHAD